MKRLGPGIQGLSSIETKRSCIACATMLEMWSERTEEGTPWKSSSASKHSMSGSLRIIYTYIYIYVSWISVNIFNLQPKKMSSELLEPTQGSPGHSSSKILNMGIRQCLEVSRCSFC